MGNCEVNENVCLRESRAWEWKDERMTEKTMNFEKKMSIEKNLTCKVYG